MTARSFYEFCNTFESGGRGFHNASLQCLLRNFPSRCAFLTDPFLFKGPLKTKAPYADFSN